MSFHPGNIFFTFLSLDLQYVSPNMQTLFKVKNWRTDIFILHSQFQECSNKKKNILGLIIAIFSFHYIPISLFFICSLILSPYFISHSPLCNHIAVYLLIGSAAAESKWHCTKVTFRKRSFLQSGLPVMTASHIISVKLIWISESWYYD